MNTAPQQTPLTREQLGPAERIIQTLITFTDHLEHNRPGVIVPSAASVVGATWLPVTYRKQDSGENVVFKIEKKDKKTIETRLGVLQDDGKTVMENGRRVGRYQPSGIFTEVAVWMYRQVAEIWKMDNDFASKWASYSWGEEHKDSKVVLAAFMLCQSRKGDPYYEGVGDKRKVIFYDTDYRDVGEAMMLLPRKDGRHFDAKLVLRVYRLLNEPAIVAINRELGFTNNLREAVFGRYKPAVRKWLAHREQNEHILQGLVRTGFRTHVMELASHVGFKPETEKFFSILRWKQVQAEDGRREIAIGKAVTASESWEGLSEGEICAIIEKEKPNWKRIHGFLPVEVGVTPAIMAAAVEAGCLSNKDLIIVTPLLEELGLLDVQEIRAKWQAALNEAEDMRAANIARNVKSQDVADKLMEGADTALKKTVEKVMKNLRVFIIVDRSQSMDQTIEAVKRLLSRFVQGFPIAQLHVAVFNTIGEEIKIPHASAQGIERAFAGVRACGGTDYSQGVRALQHHKYVGVEEDNVFIFAGDERNFDKPCIPFDDAVRMSGLNPKAFGLIKAGGLEQDRAVRETAARLEIPCFMIDERTFADAYAIPRTIANLVASTPVTPAVYGRPVPQAPRETLIDKILKTKLLEKPAWANVGSTRVIKSASNQPGA